VKLAKKGPGTFRSGVKKRRWTICERGKPQKLVFGDCLVYLYSSQYDSNDHYRDQGDVSRAQSCHVEGELRRYNGCSCNVLDSGGRWQFRNSGMLPHGYALTATSTISFHSYALSVRGTRLPQPETPPRSLAWRSVQNDPRSTLMSLSTVL